MNVVFDGSVCFELMRYGIDGANVSVVSRIDRAVGMLLSIKGI